MYQHDLRIPEEKVHLFSFPSTGSQLRIWARRVEVSLPFLICFFTGICYPLLKHLVKVQRNHLFSDNFFFLGGSIFESHNNLSMK